MGSAMETMAGCGEIVHSINMLPANKKANESCSNSTPSLTDPECAICKLSKRELCRGADSTAAQSGASVQLPVSSSIRLLTSVDGQLTSPTTPSPDAGSSLEDSCSFTTQWRQHS